MAGRSPQVASHYILEAVSKGTEGMKASGKTSSSGIQLLPQNE
jgi:hypothetical protein